MRRRLASLHDADQETRPLRGMRGLDEKEGDSFSYRLFDYFLPVRNCTQAENIFRY